MDLKTLEILVDNQGVAEILNRLSQICMQKWEVLTKIHGENKIAFEWAKASRDIEHALRSISGYPDLSIRDVDAALKTKR